jgi:hypothetical protein
MNQRPALLPVITVPTGGWTLKVYVSTDGHTYDKTLTAGDYFMSGDNQSDDLLFALQTQMKAQLVAAGGQFASDGRFYAWIEQCETSAYLHKVRMKFCDDVPFPNGNATKIAWTESTAGLAEALGFDYSADDTSTAEMPIFTADYLHAYGWYADEDGQLEDLLVYDESEVAVSQKRGPIDGRVKTCWLGSSSKNKLVLSWLSKALTYSKDVDYGDLPPYGLTRNKGLECWWREARQGKHFRLYENKRWDIAYCNDYLNITASNTTTVTDSGKAWAVNQWSGKIVATNWPTDAMGFHDFADVQQAFFVASNTATVITASNAHPDGAALGDYQTADYRLFESTYQTYVVDLTTMRSFAPHPMAPNLDYYGITIPLFRYVSP